MIDLKYELKKCKECSCSRCSLNGTNECFIEVAIKELDRYEQALDSIVIQHECELYEEIMNKRIDEIG